MSRKSTAGDYIIKRRYFPPAEIAQTLHERGFHVIGRGLLEIDRFGVIGARLFRCLKIIDSRYEELFNVNVKLKAPVAQ